MLRWRDCPGLSGQLLQPNVMKGKAKMGEPEKWQQEPQPATDTSEDRRGLAGQGMRAASRSRERPGVITPERMKS